MPSITVYQTDEDGYYIGTAIADESPREPGVFHMPRLCVQVAPPALTEGQRARRVGGAWTVVDPDPVEPEPEPTLAEAQADRLEELKQRRRVAEYGGTTFSGMNIYTDEKTQGVLTTGWGRATADPLYTITNYKIAPGVFVTLNATQIIGAALAAEAHIQACFDNERVLSDVILAADTVLAVNEVDIETGWPPTLS